MISYDEACRRMKAWRASQAYLLVAVILTPALLISPKLIDTEHVFMLWATLCLCITLSGMFRSYYRKLAELLSKTENTNEEIDQDDQDDEN